MIEHNSETDRKEAEEGIGRAMKNVPNLGESLFQFMVNQEMNIIRLNRVIRELKHDVALGRLGNFYPEVENRLRIMRAEEEKAWVPRV